MTVAIQTPALRLAPRLLRRLRMAVPRRRLVVAARVRPVVADGAEAVCALGLRDVRLVLRDPAVVLYVRVLCVRAALLRVQRRRERVNLALELGDATVGLLLALPRRRSCDAVRR